MKRFYTLILALCAFGAVSAQTKTVTFEGEYFNALIDNPQYGGNLIYSGTEYKWTDAATQLSGEVVKADWTAWGYGYGWDNGFAISNYVNPEATTYAEQLSVAKADGNFAVAYANNSTLKFADGKEREIVSIDLSPVAYAYNSMLKACGDGYEFNVILTFNKADGSKSEKVVALAKGEDVQNGFKTYAFNEKAVSIVFTFDGTDKGNYGLNTPTYVAIDNVVCNEIEEAADADITFEGDYYTKLIDNPQYNGALIYSADEYKWTDEATSLSSICDKADWTAWGYGYGWNYGCAISNYVDATASSYDKQLSVPVSNGSQNFVVVWESGSYINFADGKAHVIKSMQVINTSYALANIKKACGDGYFFKVVATGYNGETKTGEIDINLAEGENVIENWTNIDLSSLGAVTKVVFTFDGSDQGAYGLQTPKYFAFDNIKLGETVDAIFAVSNEEASIEAIYTMDGKKVSTPVKGVNIIRMSNGTSKKVFIK